MDNENEFELQLTPIELKTVRQFYLESLSLNDYFNKIGKKHVSVVDVEELCTKKIEEMIARAKEEHSGDPQQPELPLIRLRVDYTDEYLTLSANHFGQRFVNKVANPKDLILFKCKKGPIQRNIVDTNLGMIEDMIEDIYEGGGETSKHCTHIDDVINEYFENVEPQSKLSLLAEKKLTDAVKEIVEKDPQSTKINIIIDWHINAIKDHFMSKGNDLDQILKDKFLIKEIMTDFKTNLRRKEEIENRNLIDFEQLGQQYGRKKATAVAKPPKASTSKGRGKKSKNDEEDEEDEMMIEEIDSDNDNAQGFGIIAADSSTEDDETPAKKSGTGRGKARGGKSTPSNRGRGRGGRGGKSKKSELSDYFSVSK